MHIEPPTPRSTRVVRVSRGTIVAATALACAALVSACGSSSSKTTSVKTNLDTARVALSIEQTILEKRHLKAKVVCPAVVPQEQGRTFECIATTKGTKPPFPVGKTPFLVTIQNSKGYVTYQGK
jgi:uncharacterized protein DUF4333